MSRQARIKARDQIYSVVTRVNNSDFVFENEQNCLEFLDHLKTVKQKLDFKLYGFVIMASHVHLLIQTKDDIADISVVMKEINGNFAIKYNRSFGFKGHFWLERFQSKIIQNLRHLANSIIYFALNPVRAGIVDNPLKYKFSSIHATTGSTIFEDIIDDLPEEYTDFIKDFLQREKFIELILKTANKISKLYSFNLRKTKSDQKYKNFCGNHKFRSNFLHELASKFSV